MECMLCKNKPIFTSPPQYGTCKAGIHLYCVKNTVFEDTIDGIFDSGQCRSFELNERGISEFDLILVKDGPKNWY